ncbi:MAG TPA: hypothetical protein VIM29_04110 [Bacillota bacterium]
MKKVVSVLLMLMLLGGVPVLTRAAEAGSKGELVGLAGNVDAGWFNYQLTNNLKATLLYDEELLRGGFQYQFGEKFGIKAGMLYDDDLSDNVLSDTSKTHPYAGINWNLPFGNNTRLIGYYDYDYRGKEWQTYEAAVRVEMFPNQYIQVGVRGDAGDGVEPIYNYDDDLSDVDNTEALFFLRGDFSWTWKKLSLELRPLLYVQGTFLHDYDLKYKVNDQWSIMFNMNSLYDKETKYRGGVQFKF